MHNSEFTRQKRTQKMAKVNVKEVSLPSDHNVVIVPVTDAQNERGHTIASTCTSEIFDSLIILLSVST